MEDAVLTAAPYLNKVAGEAPAMIVLLVMVYGQIKSAIKAEVAPLLLKMEQMNGRLMVIEGGKQKEARSSAETP